MLRDSGLSAGTTVWDAQTFQPGNASDMVTDPKTFIEAATVMQLHQDTGKVLAEWGAKKFLMPHGLTVDTEGNIWLTDVALHQAFKFSPQGKQLLVLGTALEPGNDTHHFCKPTHVREKPDLPCPALPCPALAFTATLQQMYFIPIQASLCSAYRAQRQVWPCLLILSPGAVLGWECLPGSSATSLNLQSYSSQMPLMLPSAIHCCNLSYPSFACHQMASHVTR